MAWIESHQQLEKHPKVYDLMATMNWSLDITIGKLHRFWWWCVDYAEDGDLTKHNADRIARAMGVENGEAEKLDQAMILAKWIDIKPYRRVHDWWRYIGRFLQVKYKKYPKKWEKIRQLYTDIPNNPPNNPPNNHIPNLTVPNLTVPNLILKNQPYWAVFSKETQELMEHVYKDFNIYKCMAMLKKQKKIIQIPEAVIIKVCSCYLKNKVKVKEQWPWFLTSVQRSWEEWNAEQQVKQGQEWKKEPIAPVIKQILAGMANKEWMRY